MPVLVFTKAMMVEKHGNTLGYPIHIILVKFNYTPLMIIQRGWLCLDIYILQIKKEEFTKQLMVENHGSKLYI